MRTCPISAISARSACPTDPPSRTTGCTPALSASTKAVRSSVLTPTPPLAIPLTRVTIIARTTSGLTSAPWRVGCRRPTAAGDRATGTARRAAPGASPGPRGRGGPAHERRGELLQVLERHPVARERTNARVHPVHGVAALQHVLADPPRPPHPIPRPARAPTL